MVDEGRAFFHAGERAVGAKRDRAQVIVVADTGHHEILALGGGLRRRGGLAAEFLGPCLGLGRRPVEYGDIMAAFFDQMSRHREPHNAETEKSDFSHVNNPEVCRRIEVAGRYAGEGTVDWFGARNRPRQRNPHHKPCRMNGNASVWRAGMVL